MPVSDGGVRLELIGCLSDWRRWVSIVEVIRMAAVTTTRRHDRLNLVRHFFEMVLAMFVGMAVLGMLVKLVCVALGQPSFFLDHAGLRAPLMAMNMTIGMALWMRHRGHRWVPIGEMSAAMFVPVAVLIGPFWAGVLSGDGLLAYMHVLMLPAMVVAMLHRRDEYALDHRRHQTTFPARPATT
jgi:flagellar biosynthetic protein FliP